MVFERLFGDGGSPERRRAELKKNGSILDWMMNDMARLQRELGAGDRTRSASTSTRCAKSSAGSSARSRPTRAELPDLTRPASVPAVWEDHVKLMFDLQVLALQSDITRVITFQLARETSTRTYPQIGVPEPHHPVSHHVNDPEKLAEAGEDQRLPRVALRLPAREAGGDAGRRRVAARSHDLPARQRHGQPGRPRPHEPADRRRRRPRRAVQGRAAHPLRDADAAGQPPPDAARQGRRASRLVRGQHRPGGRPRRR